MRCSTPIHDWLREVNHSDDGVWRDRVEEYVDLRQFMTHVATEVFLAENDGLLGATGMNNFFLYRAKDTKQHRFLPWDKDSSFLLPDFSIFERADDNVLFRRAFAYPDLEKCICRRSRRPRVRRPRRTGWKPRSRARLS